MDLKQINDWSSYYKNIVSVVNVTLGCYIIYKKYRTYV